MTYKQVTQFQNLILDWFATNQRDLPWRHTHDPYAVMVSEVMLQQTQVDRVKNYWPAWLDRWPTFENLANAPTADIIRAWAGLGYNRRAVNLKRAAEFILKEGSFTYFDTLAKLQTIPGIGPGTAGALMNFVWNIDTPFLEVNIKRILQRLAIGPETINGWAKDKELMEVAKAVLPANKARIWPHALMDFGALACRPNDPFCETCPLGKILPPKRLLDKSKPSTLHPKPSIKFETTNRYWRGQILKALHTQSQSVSNLYRELLKLNPELAPNRFKQLANDLKQDGLIIIKHNRVSLP